MEEEEEEEEEEGVKRVQCRHWNGREHGKCIGKGGRENLFVEGNRTRGVRREKSCDWE